MKNPKNFPMIQSEWLPQNKVSKFQGVPLKIAGRRPAIFQLPV